jgi:putative photosynthetic complex assembly protein
MQVRFEDRPDGTLAVLDATTGREASIVQPGTNGFIRGVLRGMFRGRKLEALSRDGQFRLAREADGHLTLEDPETGRRVDLDSFGPTNSAAFAGLLAAGRHDGQAR